MAPIKATARGRKRATSDHADASLQDALNAWMQISNLSVNIASTVLSDVIIRMPKKQRRLQEFESPVASKDQEAGANSSTVNKGEANGTKMLNRENHMDMLRRAKRMHRVLLLMTCAQERFRKDMEELLVFQKEENEEVNDETPPRE